MTESVFGGTAAPHPAAIEEWAVTLVKGGGESGSFALAVGLPYGAGGTITVAHNAAVGTIQTAIRNLAGAEGASVSGGALGTNDVVLSFPIGPVTVSVDGAGLSAGGSSVSAVRTQVGLNNTKNETVLNPTGAARVDGTISRPAYTHDYTTKQTPAETYVNPDGTPLSAGGGVAASPA